MNIMKKIINRRTGRRIEDPYIARYLVKSVMKTWPGVQYDEHRAPHGRTSPFIATKDLTPIKEAHEGYITVFEGTEDCGFEGYKALFIGFKDLPKNFEDIFTNYVIIGD